jgi:hypothetical protein
MRAGGIESTMAAADKHGVQDSEPAMTHINLDTQGDAVRKFFLSLATDPEGAVVEMNGQAVARLVPIPGVSKEADAEGDWTPEKNARRCALIDREIDGTLTPAEASELAGLQRQMLRHVQRVAPLPLEATRRLYEELLAKADAARNG